MLRLCWEPKREIRSQDEAASSTVGKSRDWVMPGINIANKCWSGAFHRVILGGPMQLVRPQKIQGCEKTA